MVSYYPVILFQLPVVTGLTQESWIKITPDQTTITSILKFLVL